jgi:hypothetical protein
VSTSTAECRQLLDPLLTNARLWGSLKPTHILARCRASTRELSPGGLGPTSGFWWALEDLNL